MKLKSLIISLLLVFTLACPTFAETFTDIIVSSPNGIWTDSRAYATLNAAITAIGANERTITISSPQTVTTLTVPSNVTLRFERDGAINNSGQLTINTKKVEAPNRQIFTGAGDIDFAVGSVVKSAWFSSFVDAINQTADDELTLIVSNSAFITANCAVGNNVTLKWESARNRLTANTGFTLSNISKIDAGNYQLFAGAGDFDFTVGSVIRTAWFASFRSAVSFTADDGVDIILLVSTPGTVDYDITLNAHQKLRIDSGNILTLSAGRTLTVSSSLEAGIYRIFSGTGAVIFVAGSVTGVHPEWFADNTTPGTTDMTDAIQAAASSVNYTTSGAPIPVILSNKYLVTSTISALCDFIGPSGFADGSLAYIKYTGTGAAIEYSTYYTGIRIHNVYIDLSSNTNDNAIGINFVDGNVGGDFRDVRVHCNVSQIHYGFKFATPTGDLSMMKFTNVYVSRSSYGIYMSDDLGIGRGGPNTFDNCFMLYAKVVGYRITGSGNVWIGGDHSSTGATSYIIQFTGSWAFNETIIGGDWQPDNAGYAFRFDTINTASNVASIIGLRLLGTGGLVSDPNTTANFRQRYQQLNSIGSLAGNMLFVRGLDTLTATGVYDGSVQSSSGKFLVVKGGQAAASGMILVSSSTAVGASDPVYPNSMSFITPASDGNRIVFGTTPDGITVTKYGYIYPGTYKGIGFPAFYIEGTSPTNVSNSIAIVKYAGDPNGNVTAGRGSLCTDTTNGKLYVNRSATYGTVWTLVGP